MGSVFPTRVITAGIFRYSALILLLSTAGLGSAAESIPVSDASLSAAFYSDSSCLLTIDAHAQAGKTIIDADVDGNGSRMLIHCDTEDGRRLTLLARGDSLNVSQRVPLLTREEIEEGELGMIAWLTRSGVHYSDDAAPRRYVIAGSVLLRKSPPLQIAGSALHSQRHAFGRVTGVLEPLLNSRSSTVSEALPMQASPPETPQDSSQGMDERSVDDTVEVLDQGQTGAGADVTDPTATIVEDSDDMTPEDQTGND